ncbi:MAG: hypothetical protein EAZ24_13580 [Burkholderiales bacterium]|nr:MAG: hypothetical protein EAZ24_13580 [Burkholderiales bacterium]
MPTSWPGSEIVVGSTNDLKPASLIEVSRMLFYVALSCGRSLLASRAKAPHTNVIYLRLELKAQRFAAPCLRET